MSPVNTTHPNPYILTFQEADKTMLAIVGGKGANLGELSKLHGINVPPGFCITTTAYQEIIRTNTKLDSLFDKLSMLAADDRKAIGEISAIIRKAIEETTIPADIEQAVTRQWEQIGKHNAYAVRSSATAEDLPTASFAGQQDTYLNIIGKEAILQHISKCWASLFTDRAVIYRLQNGFDSRRIGLSVAIQQMVFPDAAGIMFTADPVTCNRKVLSVDAGFGLGEALVSGLINADNYKVRNRSIIEKKINAKKHAIYASKEGGTTLQDIVPEQQTRQVLTDKQILQIEDIGRKIEEHFGSPQDIEWCLANDTFYIVQSRPITTLYPIPEAGDQENHVYISVGHQQMMTDPLKPLGLSLFQLTAFRPMHKAGGRLFVDVAQQLKLPITRKMIVDAMGQHDPLIKDALTNIIERDDFISSTPNGNDEAAVKVMPPVAPKAPIENDPAIVAELIEHNQASIEKLKQNIRSKSGAALFVFILEDIKELKRILFDPQSSAVFMAAIDASLWLNEKMDDWLGEKGAANILSLSVPNNITSEMGLALLEVADVIRPYPAIISYLQQANDNDFLSGLTKFNGGQAVVDSIGAFLQKYGMRCTGEIDITRPRWIEKPITLIPIILNNINGFAPDESYRKFEQGQQQALKKEQELLERLKQLPDGRQKAAETKRMIDLVRGFIGYREYPKYGMVNRYFVYRQAILKEAEQLALMNVIDEKDDIYYLTFEELRDAISNKTADRQIIGKRKEEYKVYQKLTPPRVITSDGEIVTGSYRRKNLPDAAMAGLPVSSGIVEGRARVILNMEDAEINEGDILVTTFTDPSWTPLFISIKGLVTEVGGMMTHGAVVAREYGLPAVVGVQNATKLIKDGQRIRVNGTDGYVEILQ